MIAAMQARPFLWQRLEEGFQTLHEVIDLLIECGEEDTPLCRTLLWMHDHNKWPYIGRVFGENAWMWNHTNFGGESSNIGPLVFVHLSEDCVGWTGRKTYDRNYTWSAYRSFQGAISALSIALELSGAIQ